MISWSERERIREAYAKTPLVCADGRMVSAYGLGIDWFSKFSPIEDKAWDCIRYVGAPLYPQYPVGRFFIDFADPIRRIGIEIDGLAYHKDRKKDRVRQIEIEGHGWTIYRFWSWELDQCMDDFLDDEGNVKFNEYAEGCLEGKLWDLYRRKQ